jgi:uncharacterized low-complexity protein
MAALGEMTLKAVMGALALVLGPHWAVSDAEAKTWGEAFEAWLKAQPAKRRKALTNALTAVPTLNLVVATGMVVAPRVQATLAMSKSRKEKEVANEEREREGNVGGNRAGGGESRAASSSRDYASAIAKALGGDVGESSPGSGAGDSQVFPKA